MHDPAAIVLTRDQLRALDRAAVEIYGIPGIVLMENAGRGVAEALVARDPRVLPAAGREPLKVAVLCGKGNNAGDGFVVARHLLIRGGAPVVALLADPRQLVGDAAVNYQILVRAAVPRHDLSATPPDRLDEALDRAIGDAGWLVDALLGAGARGNPREPLATAIRWCNRRAARRLAVDLPSGLDGDTGVPGDPTLQAEATCTLAALKPGLLDAPARPFVGEVSVASIGVPPSLLRSAATGAF